MNNESATAPKIAFYGGSFDPVHRGHLSIAHRAIKLFSLDEFVFVPAFHAPHKKRLAPTPAIDRYAMLALSTNNEPKISVSKIEIEVPHKPYTVETLSRLKDLLPDTELFFVMGADSWRDIRTWREWEKVLTLTNHIVVTRPGFDLSRDHLTQEMAHRIVDVRGQADPILEDNGDCRIYFTDIVNLNVSASDIRKKIRGANDDWRDDVPLEVAKYIEKYQIYS
jgi:nicotinate-nucleotide adenylyltransferase